MDLDFFSFFALNKDFIRESMHFTILQDLDFHDKNFGIWIRDKSKNIGLDFEFLKPDISGEHGVAVLHTRCQFV